MREGPRSLQLVGPLVAAEFLHGGRGFVQSGSKPGKGETRVVVRLFFDFRVAPTTFHEMPIGVMPQFVSDYRGNRPSASRSAYQVFQPLAIVNNHQFVSLNRSKGVRHVSLVDFGPFSYTGHVQDLVYQLFVGTGCHLLQVCRGKTKRLSRFLTPIVISW